MLIHLADIALHKFRKKFLSESICFDRVNCHVQELGALVKETCVVVYATLLLHYLAVEGFVKHSVTDCHSPFQDEYHLSYFTVLFLYNLAIWIFSWFESLYKSHHEMFEFSICLIDDDLRTRK